jgi:hypothetical protein
MGESYLNPPGPAYFATVFYQLFIHLIYVLSSFQEGCYILQLKPESKRFCRYANKDILQCKQRFTTRKRGELPWPFSADYIRHDTFNKRDI